MSGRVGKDRNHCRKPERLLASRKPLALIETIDNAITQKKRRPAILKEREVMNDGYSEEQQRQKQGGSGERHPSPPERGTALYQLGTRYAVYYRQKKPSSHLFWPENLARENLPQCRQMRNGHAYAAQKPQPCQNPGTQIVPTGIGPGKGKESFD